MGLQRVDAGAVCEVLIQEKSWLKPPRRFVDYTRRYFATTPASMEAVAAICHLPQPRSQVDAATVYEAIVAIQDTTGHDRLLEGWGCTPKQEWFTVGAAAPPRHPQIAASVRMHRSFASACIDPLT